MKISRLLTQAIAQNAMAQLASTRERPTALTSAFCQKTCRQMIVHTISFVQKRICKILTFVSGFLAKTSRRQ